MDERVAEAHVPDRLAIAGLPRLSVTDAQQHLGVGVGLCELAVEKAARPVHRRLVALEDLAPQLLAVERTVPQLDLIEVGDQVDPVVARVEAKLLERELLRECPGARQARADQTNRGCSM